MRESRWSWLVLPCMLLVGISATLLTSCDLANQPTSAPGAPTETPSISEQTPETPPATLPPDATPPAPSVITLTVWTTDAISPTQAITSGQILAQQVIAFEETRPDARLEFVLKKPYGKGGILDFLLTTGAVVPDLLPDLAILDVDELKAAAQADLVQPLDDLLPSDLIADLYPFARQSCTFDGRLYGLQFQADLDHLVYNTGKMTIAPRSWPGVLSNPGPYIFPAGGQAGLVNDSFLIQYLAVRAQPEGNDAEEPFLEAESLAAVLQFYQDGISQGIFPPEILDYHTTTDCWRDYLAGEAAQTQVAAHHYLTDRQQAQNSAAAPIPAITGPGMPISRGWALVLITSDPTHQSAAVEFMLRWMAPETNATWNLAAAYLPTRQAALALWDEADSYVPFIGQQLATARPRPAVPNYTRVAAALQQAVIGVLTGVATPEEAAAQAIEESQ